VVKKRKGSRPASASRGKKKKKKAAARPKARPARRQLTGLEDDSEVDFRPLKDLIAAHVQKLSAKTYTNPKVQKALDDLRLVQSSLSVDCEPTMVLPLS
jgi:hypothetical protein